MKIEEASRSEFEGSDGSHIQPHSATPETPKRTDNRRSTTLQLPTRYDQWLISCFSRRKICLKAKL